MRDLIIEEMEPSHKTPKLKDWYVKPIEMIANNWAIWIVSKTPNVDINPGRRHRS